MAIADSFLPEFGQEMANTRKMLALVPDDKLDYAPHGKSMKMGRLSSHIAEMAGWAVNIVNTSELDVAPVGGPSYQPFIAGSRDELLAAFDKNVAAVKDAVAGASDEALMTSWSLLAGGKNFFTMPRIAVLKSMVLNHIIHHRAQLGVYLRMNDVPIPGMYGPSADDTPAM
jgi:uncharacterized damage-inducible protein DinB